jgi:hypothetical protein
VFETTAPRGIFELDRRSNRRLKKIASPRTLHVLSRWNKQRPRWAWNVACAKQWQMCTKSCAENFEGKGQFGRPKCRREDNVGIDNERIGQEIMDCMHLDQNRIQWWGLINTIMNFRIPRDFTWLAERLSAYNTYGARDDGSYVQNECLLP